MAVIACTNPGESPRRLSARNEVLLAEVRVGNVLDPLPQLRRFTATATATPRVEEAGIVKHANVMGVGC